MTFRTPADIREEFLSHQRRALILTTVPCEGHAVKAHLSDVELLMSDKGQIYEYGRFTDPAGDWLVVHTLTSQGNSDAGLVTAKAFQDFGSFNVAMFVGVAGSLKDDILIGSVVVGDYVYNGHSGKVGDQETFGRPHGLAPARDLLNAAHVLIYLGTWIELIRAPHGIELPQIDDYPCKYPPTASIKGIVSGEEVVSGDKSARYNWLRTHFNDCGAVEMEGWGVMNAAHHENAPAIIVRGISDMCAGKAHEADALNQPIAAAHAAAFAFSILSFRSKAPNQSDSPLVDAETKTTLNHNPSVSVGKEQRMEVVFNFEGDKKDWTDEKIDSAVEMLKQSIGDETIRFVRIDDGSVRLIISMRQSYFERINLDMIRQASARIGLSLLGAIPEEMLDALDKASTTLKNASIDLLSWEKNLPNSRWIERPEQKTIKERFQLENSSTVLLGEPGSGKSALLSKIANDLINQKSIVFALKADYLPINVETEADLQNYLQLPELPSQIISSLAQLQPVYVLIDQLDALASQLDLKSGRLNVLLNLVREIGSLSNIHVLVSARSFEFNHDVRLRVIEAEPLNLALPPWHEVKQYLDEVGINAEGWPETACEVVRIPQALKTFIALESLGKSEPFSTYQSMLHHLWQERIASASDSKDLISLVSEVAQQMAENEALWLAISRFDDRLKSLERLEALGFLVRSENNLSIAFSHQTVFEYVLARTFIRNDGLLSTYVLDRQDSLFVRAKIWSALNYLRGAEADSYRREFLAIWKTPELRSHIRLLLIEFLGQVNEPSEFEQSVMNEVLKSSDTKIYGLKAISHSSGWFKHFAKTIIPKAMSASDIEAGHACQILIQNWENNGKLVTDLLRDQWIPEQERDTYTWMVINECPSWTEEVEAFALTILSRSRISTWSVEYAALAVAVDNPRIAMRLLRAKLDFLLNDLIEKLKEDIHNSNNPEQDISMATTRRALGSSFRGLLESRDWNEIVSFAEAAPTEFVEELWSWYANVFSKLLDQPDLDNPSYIYPGQYRIELDFRPLESRSSAEKPLLTAIQIAVEEMAKTSGEKFKSWVIEVSSHEVMATQQLIARGYTVSPDKFASEALEWLLEDQRRFQLGCVYGHRQTTADLITACAPFWNDSQITSLENALLEYKPTIPDHLSGPEQRKTFLDITRTSRKELLKAVGIDRLSEDCKTLVATEERALGRRYEQSIGQVRTGWIGSPMEASSMEKAKDRDILKILSEIPDETSWDHPRHMMRGGNIQLSRAFAEFAKSNPERSIRLIEQFEPKQQERAAGYALEMLAGEAKNNSLVIDAFIDLHARGFHSHEYRDSAARAIEKIAQSKTELNDDVIAILKLWLNIAEIEENDEVENQELDLDSTPDEDEIRNTSILWGYGNSFSVPSGNYNILSALASVLLNRGEDGRDQYVEILDEHLHREKNQKLWKALLHKLSNAGGTSPKVLSTFLRKLFTSLPDIVNTKEAIFFLAHAQRWDDEFVLELISGWKESKSRFLQQAYGELVGLVASVKNKKEWVLKKDEIIHSGTDGMKIGLAFSMVNSWPEQSLRKQACDTLIELLTVASKELVAVVMDVFRVTDELIPDETVISLLRKLAAPSTDLSMAPADFVVDRLQSLLPYEPELVAAISLKLVEVWKGELSDIRTRTSIVAPQLTDLALTLHRLGGSSRKSGVDLFEAMIEIDAYGAKSTLDEIDGRFSKKNVQQRRRISRRRRSSANRNSGFA